MLIGLFRMLLILALVYFLVKLFRYLFSPGKREEPGSAGQGSKRKEGEVNVQHTPKKQKIVPKEDGEYVDFEEIDK